jgi:hypothetical protein
MRQVSLYLQIARKAELIVLVSSASSRGSSLYLRPAHEAELTVSKLAHETKHTVS